MSEHKNCSAESCDLKPCPFCGSPAERLSEGAITCSNSGCPVVCGAPSQGYQLGYDPVSSWNTRTFTDAQPARKYDLRAFARFLYEHCALDPDKAGDVAATILSEYDVRPDDFASPPSPAATVDDGSMHGEYTPVTVRASTAPHNGSSAGSAVESVLREALERAREAVNAIVLSTHSISFDADLRAIDAALAFKDNSSDGQSTEQGCYNLGYDNPAKSSREFTWRHLVDVNAYRCGQLDWQNQQPRNRYYRREDYDPDTFERKDPPVILNEPQAALTPTAGIDLLGEMKHGHAEPVADRHYVWAVAEITQLRQKVSKLIDEASFADLRASGGIEPQPQEVTMAAPADVEEALTHLKARSGK